jgi:hypothetical protein
MRNAYKILIGKCNTNLLPGKPGRKSENNIKIEDYYYVVASCALVDVHERIEAMFCLHLQGRKCRVPQL